MGGKAATPENRPAEVQGFRGTVEPIWARLGRQRARLGFPRYLGRQLAFAGLISRIRRRVEEQLDPDGDDEEESPPKSRWYRRKGEAVCRIEIAKLGFLQNVREYATRKLERDAQKLLSHFLQNRDWNSFYVPVDFEKPFSVRGNGKELVPVGSSIQLRKELRILDRLFGFRKRLGKIRLGARVRISEQDIVRFDQENEDLPDFWIHFGFLVLEHLAEESVHHDLPICFG